MTDDALDAALARVALTGWRLDALRGEILSLVKEEVEEEREACAKIAERESYTGEGIDDIPELTIARKIRARSASK